MPDGPRIVVVGTSGAGKTTLAARVAERLGIRHVEIDALHHGPNWTPRPEFLDDVRALAAGESWITEWQYDAARQLLLERATLAVWVDHPLRVRLARNLRRTLWRRLRRVELWNGNHEPPLRTFFTDPDHIVRWAWRTRHKYDDLPVQLAERGRPDLPIVRLRSQREADRWLATL